MARWFCSGSFVAVPKTTAGASRAVVLTTDKMLFVANTILGEAKMNPFALDTILSLAEAFVSTTDTIASMTERFSQCLILMSSKRIYCSQPSNGLSRSL